MKPPRDFTVALSTGKWDYVLEPIHGITVKAAGVVIIEPCAETRDRLNTVVHETLHASKPNLSEAEVDRIATDVAKVLWRAGYRRTK